MANKVHEIAFKIAGKIDGGFSSTFKKAASTVNVFGQNLNKLNEQAAKVDKLIRLKKEVGEAAREYSQAKIKVAELGRQMAQTANPTQKMVAEFNRAKNAANTAKNALERKRQTLKDTEKQYGMTGQSLKQLIQRQNELTASANRARKAQERLNKINEKQAKIAGMQSKLNSGAMSGAAGLTGMAVAAGGTVGIPVKEAMAMEDAMAEVRKVTDYTPEGLQQARKEIETMSTRIPMAADGLARIMASAAQSGVAQENLIEFTEQAAKMGVAFDITAEEAGEMMAKWQSGMGLAQDQTFKLADAVNALSNANAATGAQIGEVLKRYGALGKVSGLNEKQTAAFAASVVASGAEAEVAATGIKAFMRSMSKGGSMTKKQAGAFANVGVDPIALQKNLQKDAPAAIISTLEAIQKSIPKEQWNQYLSVMFGEEAAVAVGPMMTNLEGLKNNFKMVANEAGYADSMLNEFKARSETTSNALILAKNSALYAARAIGQPLLEPLKKLSAEFVQTAIKVGQWIQKNQTLVMGLLKVAGVITGLIAAFWTIKIAIWAVVSPIMSLYRGYLLLQKGIMLVQSGLLAQKVALIVQKSIWIAQKTAMIAAKGAMLAVKGVMLLVTAAQWALNVAMTANPIGLVIAALAALVVAGIAVYKNWDTIKEKIKELWEYVKNFFGKIGETISNAWEKVKGFFGGGKTTIEVAAKAGNVPQLARGGIATRPTLAMIGEGNESEAVLPLSKLNSMIGGGTSGGGIDGGITINFSPVINVSGGGADAYSQAQRGVEAGAQSLKKELERVMAEQRRLSYA